MDHFKKVLENDVRVISSLPSTHVMTRPVEEKRTPLHASPEWIRSHYSKRVRNHIVAVIMLSSYLAISNDCVFLKTVVFLCLVKSNFSVLGYHFIYTILFVCSLGGRVYFCCEVWIRGSQRTFLLIFKSLDAR